MRPSGGGKGSRLEPTAKAASAAAVDDTAELLRQTPPHRRRPAHHHHPDVTFELTDDEDDELRGLGPSGDGGLPSTTAELLAVPTLASGGGHPLRQHWQADRSRLAPRSPLGQRSVNTAQGSAAPSPQGGSPKAEKLKAEAVKTWVKMSLGAAAAAAAAAPTASADLSGVWRLRADGRGSPADQFVVLRQSHGQSHGQVVTGHHAVCSDRPFHLKGGSVVAQQQLKQGGHQQGGGGVEFAFTQVFGNGTELAWKGALVPAAAGSGQSLRGRWWSAPGVAGGPTGVFTGGRAGGSNADMLLGPEKKTKKENKNKPRRARAGRQRRQRQESVGPASDSGESDLRERVGGRRAGWSTANAIENGYPTRAESAASKRPGPATARQDGARQDRRIGRYFGLSEAAAAAAEQPGARKKRGGGGGGDSSSSDEDGGGPAADRSSIESLMMSLTHTLDGKSKWPLPGSPRAGSAKSPLRAVPKSLGAHNSSYDDRRSSPPGSPAQRVEAGAWPLDSSDSSDGGGGGGGGPARLKGAAVAATTRMAKPQTTSPIGSPGSRGGGGGGGGGGGRSTGVAADVSAASSGGGWRGRQAAVDRQMGSSSDSSANGSVELARRAASASASSLDFELQVGGEVGSPMDGGERIESLRLERAGEEEEQMLRLDGSADASDLWLEPTPRALDAPGPSALSCSDNGGSPVGSPIGSLSSRGGGGSPSPSSGGGGGGGGLVGAAQARLARAFSMDTSESSVDNGSPPRGGGRTSGSAAAAAAMISPDSSIELPRGAGRLDADAADDADAAACIAALAASPHLASSPTVPEVQNDRGTPDTARPGSADAPAQGQMLFTSPLHSLWSPMAGFNRHIESSASGSSCVDTSGPGASGGVLGGGQNSSRCSSVLEALEAMKAELQVRCCCCLLLLSCCCCCSSLRMLLFLFLLILPRSLLLLFAWLPAHQSLLFATQPLTDFARLRIILHYFLGDPPVSLTIRFLFGRPTCKPTSSTGRT